MSLSIDLSESEIHMIRLAIDTTRGEWDDYLADPKVSADWELTQVVRQRALRLKYLSARFADLAMVPTP